MLDYLEAVVLGLIQGLTEFLPISSSAHLRILPEWFGWGDPGAAFTAVIQIGTELAVLIFFRHDIWRIGSTWVRSLYRPEYRGHLDARMGWYVIVGSLPIVVLGVLLKDVIERDLRNLWFIGVSLIVFGLILGVADRFAGTRGLKQVGLKDAILLGLAQALALMPGVSRSGATISMGLFLGMGRETATRFAFLLAIPAVVGAGLFELKEIPNGQQRLRLGTHDRGDGGVVHRRVRRDRLAAALRLDALLPAVRHLPGGARSPDARPALGRCAERLALARASRSACR